MHFLKKLRYYRKIGSSSTSDVKLNNMLVVLEKRRVLGFHLAMPLHRKSLMILFKNETNIFIYYLNKHNVILTNMKRNIQNFIDEP